MVSRFTILFVLITSCVQAQTLLQSGEIIGGRPTRIPIDYSGNSVNSIELVTVNNYNIAATQVYAFNVNALGELIYADTLQFAEVLDTLGNVEMRQHQYQYGVTVGGMVILAGLSHRTVMPFVPKVICAGGFGSYSPYAGWIDRDYYVFNWQFSPVGVEYNRFDPRFVSYATSQHPNNEGVRITGAFNRFEGSSVLLDVYDIYPEESLPTHKLFSLPLETTFFINHSIELDRKLLLSGFWVDMDAGFLKRPKAVLIDLESQEVQELILDQTEYHVEVISGLVADSDRCFLILRETDNNGQLVESRILRFDANTNANVIASFSSQFVPASIVSETSNGILIGGDYNRFGLKTASVFEVNGYAEAEPEMIGYAELGEVATSFKGYEETLLGNFLVGTYDSLNGTPKGSFMTPILGQSLLSVGERRTEDLATLLGDMLFIKSAEPVQLRVFDLEGRIFLAEKINSGPKDLSHLVNGVYLISVWNNETRQTLKTVFVTH